MFKFNIWEVEKRIPEYPQDVQELLKKIATTFSFPTIPAKTRKGGGTYGMWIKELRYIKSEYIKGRGLEPIEWAYQDYLKRPREVSHPAALNSLIFNAIREQTAIEQKNKQQQYQQAQRHTAHENSIPAPSNIQPL